MVKKYHHFSLPSFFFKSQTSSQLGNTYESLSIFLPVSEGSSGVPGGSNLHLVVVWTPLKKYDSVGMMTFHSQLFLESHSKFHGSSHHQPLYFLNRWHEFWHGLAHGPNQLILPRGTWDGGVRFPENPPELLRTGFSEDSPGLHWNTTLWWCVSYSLRTGKWPLK
mgnify:CR=1 FL=1